MHFKIIQKIEESGKIDTRFQVKRGELFVCFENIFPSKNLRKNFFFSLMIKSTKKHRKGFVPKIKFTADEDKRLSDLVYKVGQEDWDLISRNMINRTPRQCRERWINYIAPNLSNEPWTKEEDDLLDELYTEYGSRWHKIAEIFPNRSGNAVRNRFKLRQRRQEKLEENIQKNEISNDNQQEMDDNKSDEAMNDLDKSKLDEDTFSLFNIDFKTLEDCFLQ